MKILFIYTLIFLNPVLGSLFAQELSWVEQKSSSGASLRGLYVIDDAVVWASGADGSILRTLDAGKSWEQLPAPDSLDFRSLWAFGKAEAMVASAGQPAVVYYTADAGKHWQKVFSDTTGEAFFDALVFWDEQRGWLLGDPVGGEIMLLETRDKGQSWHALSLPPPAAGEAFFAASNGSLALAGKGKAWIGTGGSAIRLLSTPDTGNSWRETAVSMPRFSEAAGIYALAFAHEQMGVAVGGAYDKPAEGSNAALYTHNGGLSWALAQTPPAGYRCGIAAIPGSSTFVAVGTNGADISTDGGKTWRLLNRENLNSIRFSPSGNIGWAVGAKGSIWKISVH